jgi:RNA polymerase sigma-70 factor (ECF subfamily)
VAGPKRPSDEEILDAFERGDAASSGQLFDRLIDTVDATIYRVMGRRESDHEDLIQTSFEQIILSLAKGRFARACSLSSWASSVASHVALNALRSRIRERRVVDRSDGAEVAREMVRGSHDIERESGVREQMRRLRAALAEMDPAKAQTVLLHEGMGYELSEIAVLTGVSIAAAQSRLVRGRKELQSKLLSAETSRGEGP